jgi:hypothetical protein
MKLTYSPTPYQWHDGNQHHVGLMALVGSNGRAITFTGNFRVRDLNEDDWALMSHSHTRELEFVKYGLLKPYPSSPIPQP